MSEFTEVRRANVILTIKSTEVERYLDMGFDVLDDDGSVVQQAVPNDVHELQSAFRNHVKTIDELTSKINALENELKKSKATKGKSKTTEE